MTEPINPLVVDLSHWDPAEDYDAVRRDGIVGVIYKATEGVSYTDDTYGDQRREARAAGLLWGAYHFADGSNVEDQVSNFLDYAAPDPDELFCLDWEDNPGGSKMSVNQVKSWIEQVEGKLHRPNQCVLYGGNTIKEALEDSVDPFFSQRRLWLCQYGSNPEVPASWDNYWLWQFTDGDYGPTPHSIDGIGPCDINSYDGEADQLRAEWAQSYQLPIPPQPAIPTVRFRVRTSGVVRVVVSVNGEVVLSERE